MTSLRTDLSLPTLRALSNSPSFIADPLGQDSLQKTMSLTQRESMWMLTHSPRSGTGMMFPSPSSTAFEVPVTASRPMTSGISSLTVRENEKLERRLAIVEANAVRGQLRTAAATIGGEERFVTTPSDRDFKRVLARLEKLATSTGAAYGRVNLKDGKPYDITLDEGDRQTFKITTKGQPCPLRVYIKRTGKSILYASRTVMEPSEAIYDVTTKGEKMLLSDPGLKFRNENMFLTVVSLEDIRLTITIGFGREMQEGPGKLMVRKRVIHKDDTLKALDEIKRDEHKMEELVRKVERIELQRKEAALLRSQAKDFVAINRAVSPPRPEVYSERQRALAVRTSQAKTVRAQNIEAKKERALAMIYRREQLQEEAKQVQLADEAIRKKELMERNILTVLFVGLSFEGINRTFIEGRLRYVEAQRKSMAAKRIQRQIRMWFSRQDRVGLALLISRSALWLFTRQCGTLIRASTERQIKRCIEESRTNHKLPNVVKTFYSRCKRYSVSLLIAVWRLYREKLRKQWTDLEGVWGLGLEKLKKASVMKKTTGKKAKGGKKKDDTMVFYNISAAAKKTVLANYLLEQKKKYRSKVQDYLAGSKLLIQIGAKAFHMRYASLDDDELRVATAAPDFKFLPTVDEMTKLVEAAVALSS